MREIKFRAWHEPNKIMLDVIAINFSLMEITADIETRKIYPELDYWWKETDIPFSEIELMQSTGLCDKYGVEIYERDIAEYKTVYEWDKKPTKRGEIVFENGVFSPIGVEMDLSRSEIIGNIYENPELLKSEE